MQACADMSTGGITASHARPQLLMEECGAAAERMLRCKQDDNDLDNRALPLKGAYWQPVRAPYGRAYSGAYSLRGDLARPSAGRMAGMRADCSSIRSLA